jgi:hypothetical protein
MIDKYKYFTYNIRKFKGSRLTIGEGNLRYFKSIKYDGFTVLQYVPQHQMIYKVELQTIRKLKLKQLSDISKKSIEWRILHIIKASKEREEYPEPWTGWSTTISSVYGTYTTSGNSGNRNYYDDIDKNQLKERQKYQANQYNQKLKYGRR